MFKGHSKWVTTVAFSPVENVLASTSRDQTVRLWDAHTGAALQTLEGHSDCVNAVAFSPDGKVLASASGDIMLDGIWSASRTLDTTVRVWDARTGEVMQTLEVDAVVQMLSFSVDGAYLETDMGLLRIALLS